MAKTQINPKNLSKVVELKRSSTAVAKPIIDKKLKKQPTYKYVDADVNLYRRGKPYNRQDSLDYKEGYDRTMDGPGFWDVPSKNAAGSAEASNEIKDRELNKSKKK